MANKIDCKVTVPENLNNYPYELNKKTDFSNDLEPFSYTYQYVSKPILKNLEVFDQTFEGFAKREIITRIQAIFISIFQIADFIHQTKQISCLTLDRLSSSFGFKNLTNEQLKIVDHQLRTHSMKASQSLFGALFGSLLSVINPGCY